ncbi:MAG: FAD-dependent oxidoreductase [Candidatus Tenebribacter burtonii]|nr:FAD-dependent oxidoreductase [Candidatus Tenebribacter burtonii]
MRLSDFKGIFKTSKVEFISAVNIDEDYYVISLKKPECLMWRPGEHAIFTLPGNKVAGKKYRAFSIASTPEEDVILLGTRTGKDVSSFKQNLINMKQGELVKLRGPFGWFTLQDSNSPVVFIGLGVGVTPFRALLKSFDQQENRNLEFIYSSSNVFLFKDEINKIVEQNDKFNMFYTRTIEETNDAISESARKYVNKAFYYIGGSQKAIKSITKLLKMNGIKSKKIINDPFLGY